jgi:hypothetical protein
VENWNLRLSLHLPRIISLFYSMFRTHVSEQCHCQVFLTRSFFFFFFFFSWAQSASLLGFLEHIKTHTHTHTHTREDSPERSISPSHCPLPGQHTTNTTNEYPMSSTGLEPAIAEIDWLQSYALDPTATGIGLISI